MKLGTSTSLKRFFLAGSIFVSGALLVVIVMLRHLATLSKPLGEGVGIVIGPLTMGSIFAVLLLLASSAIWLSRKLVR